MQSHTTLGFEMLNHSDRELLKTAALVAVQHHEKWDGTGYPKGLKGEEIHIFGRLTAIADVSNGSRTITTKKFLPTLKPPTTCST